MNDSIKKLVALKALEGVKDGMTLGLGTGSTARFFIEGLYELIHQGLNIRGCATSVATSKLAIKNKIPLVSINKVDSLDYTVDGCDQYDSKKQLIKGLGGALLREKIIANLSKTYVVICDDSKKRKQLGNGTLPLEVVAVADQLILRQLEALGYKGEIRAKNNIPFVTDNQNHIIDLQFDDSIEKPRDLHQKLINIPGVLETGFFFDFATKIIVGGEGDQIEVLE